MAFDSKRQREIMGRFATGVTIVTTHVNGRPNGITANAVTSVSLEPPLVLVCVDRRGSMHESLTQARCFAVNVLSAEHEELSTRFAKSGPKDFSDLQLAAGTTGAPILSGALGYVDCRVTEVHPGGDHDIFLGEIVDGGWGDGEPLLFYGGEYRRLTSGS